MSKAEQLYQRRDSDYVEWVDRNHVARAIRNARQNRQTIHRIYYSAGRRGYDINGIVYRPTTWMERKHGS